MGFIFHEASTLIFCKEVGTCNNGGMEAAHSQHPMQGPSSNAQTGLAGACAWASADTRRLTCIFRSCLSVAVHYLIFTQWQWQSTHVLPVMPSSGWHSALHGSYPHSVAILDMGIGCYRIRRIMYSGPIPKSLYAWGPYPGVSRKYLRGAFAYLTMFAGHAGFFWSLSHAHAC